SEAMGGSPAPGEPARPPPTPTLPHPWGEGKEGGAGGGPRQLSVRSTAGGAGAVTVSVCDSGPGIAPEHLGKVFDAFFTTKPGGIGVGLAISRSIIEGHGGTIRVEACPAGGAAFHFTLPAAQGP